MIRTGQGSPSTGNELQKRRVRRSRQEKENLETEKQRTRLGRRGGKGKEVGRIEGWWIVEFV